MKTTLTLLTALLALPAWAQSPADADTTAASAPPKTTAIPVGAATRSLLQRQRAGLEASATPRAIPGAVADLSHQRYLKSFEQPVPAWFGSHLEPQSK